MINIVDSPPGNGKTSWAIEYMNSTTRDSHKFLFVTPFLNEIARIKKAVKTREVYEPRIEKGKSKLDDLHILLEKGRDICTTHALFKLFNSDTRRLLIRKGYTLILDEVLNVIEQIRLRENSIDLLLEADAIYIEVYKGKQLVRWNEQKKSYDTEYNDIKSMALSGNLMMYNDSALVLNFPCDIFGLFKQVFVLTYMFYGQIQRYYFDLHKIRYKFLSVRRVNQTHQLIPYCHRNVHDKSWLKAQINIYEGKLNAIGDPAYSLSKKWLTKKVNATKLRKVAYNFLTNKLKAKACNTLWTTVKGENNKIKDNVKPKNFATSFLSMTTRATNEYKDRFNLAYMVNRFMNPIEKNFFEQYDIKVEENRWALAELIQWVWRSRIREGQPINLFIPSRRMRDLLIQYLNSDQFETLPENVIIDQECDDWHA